MPSIGNSIRQIPRETAFYSNLIDPNDVFEFVPSSGNYVGNYYPGYMTRIADLSPSVQQYIGTQLNQQIQFIERDFGKTIEAPIDSLSNYTQIGRFRHIQIIIPTGIVTDPKYSTSGIIGSDTLPDQNSKYFNFYICEAIQGRGACQFILPIAGGSM